MSNERIARVWHGYTTYENALNYEMLLKNKIIPKIKADSGKQHLLEVNIFKKNNKKQNEMEFLTILWFKNMNSIKKWFGNADNVFTENDYTAAHIPYEARKLLKRWDEYATHYSLVYKSKI